MRSKLLGAVILMAAVAALIPVLAYAGKDDTENGFSKLFVGWLREGVPAGESVDHSVFVVGEEVEIAGDIDGDVWCAGQHVRITGTVTGDVICAGQEIEVAGPVVGSVRLAGETVRVQGAVVGNVSLMGRHLAIDDNAEVDSEVHLFGESAVVSGVVGRDVVGDVARLSIDGTIKRDVRVAAEHLTITTPGTIAGNLYYRSGKQADIPAGQIKGTTAFINASDDQAYKQLRAESLVFKFKGNLRRLMAGLLLGGVLVWLWPERVRDVKNRQRTRPVATLLVGMAALAVLPVAFVMLCLTLIGAPLALLLALTFAGLAVVAVPLLAINCGNMLLTRLKTGRAESLWYCLMAGLGLFFALSFIPGARGFICILAVMWGWGVAVWSMFNRRDPSLPSPSQGEDTPKA